MKKVPLLLILWLTIGLTWIAQGQSVLTNKTVKSVAIGPNNSYVILHGRNGFSSKDIPVNLYNKLVDYNRAGAEIKQVLLNQDGGYLVLANKNDYYYQGLSDKLATVLRSNSERGDEFKHVAVSATGGHVVLFAPTQQSGRNYLPSGVPQDLLSALFKCYKNNEVLNKVVFGPDDSFLILTNKNGYTGSDLSNEVNRKLAAIAETEEALNEVVLTTNGYVINSGSGHIQYKAISDELVKNLAEPPAFPSVQAASSLPINKEADCEWREKEVEINAFGNDELILNAHIVVTICDENGKFDINGSYVHFVNLGNQTAYYGAASIYGDRASSSFVKGTSMNFYLRSVKPGAKEIIKIIEGKTLAEEKLPTIGVLRVKYCKPPVWPTTQDYKDLSELKKLITTRVNQQQQRSVESAPAETRTLARENNQQPQSVESAPAKNRTSTGGNNHVADCKYYLAFFNVYYTSGASIGGFGSKGATRVVFSDIVQASVALRKYESNNGANPNHQQYDFPQAPGYWDKFSSQNLLSDARINTTEQGLPMDTGRYSILEIHWSDNKAELEELKRKYATYDSWKSNFEENTTLGPETYKSYTDNSLFTFNQAALCR